MDKTKQPPVKLPKTGNVNKGKDEPKQEEPAWIRGTAEPTKKT